MKRGRKGVLEKDTDTLSIYTNDYYSDVELPQGSYGVDEIDQLCLDFGTTRKSLIELICRGYKFKSKSIWKSFNDDREPIRLV